MVQKHEVKLAQTTSDPIHRQAIHQSTVRTFFTPIADLLLKSKGTIAIVEPFTACTSTSGKHERNLLTDPKRFNLELVVTSHDNRRIYFSENTGIHESLIIARRPIPKKDTKMTAFISLAENPASASEAHYLAKAIRRALAGDNSRLSDYGTIAWRSIEQLRDKPWNAASFYDQSLADAYDSLLQNSALQGIDLIANVQPAGQGVRGTFNKAQNRQNPDMRALWSHKSGRQVAMGTGPDEFIVAKPGKQGHASHLWTMRGNLLLANRMRLNLARTPAVFSYEPILGSAFIPVTPRGKNNSVLCKAWCVWFNSTPGVISFLNIRQKNLSYPNFSLDGLRNLPVPRPDKCDVLALASAFDQYAGDTLLALPEMDKDTVREALDDVVLGAVPGLSSEDIERWRTSIPLEPSVNNKQQPLRLS